MSRELAALERWLEPSIWEPLLSDEADQRDLPVLLEPTVAIVGRAAHRRGIELECALPQSGPVLLAPPSLVARATFVLAVSALARLERGDRFEIKAVFSSASVTLELRARGANANGTVTAIDSEWEQAAAERATVRAACGIHGVTMEERGDATSLLVTLRLPVALA
jgi:hypothetical protein